MRAFIFNKETGKLAQGNSWRNKNGEAVRDNALKSSNADSFVIIEKSDEQTAQILSELTPQREIVLIGGKITLVDLPKPDGKQEAIERVRDYAEEMRIKFSGGARDGKRDIFQVNSDILNLRAIGKTWDEMPASYIKKIDMEIAETIKYQGLSRDQLLDIWEQKREPMIVASAWIESKEDNAIRAIEQSNSQEELETIMVTLKQQAEAKEAELLGK